MKKLVTIFAILLIFATCSFTLTACDTTNKVSYPEDKTITICSYNIRLWLVIDATTPNDNWNVRKPEFEKHIKAINADLYGMQEVMGAQRKQIIEMLPEYTHVGVCRETGKEDGIGESSSIFFRTSRFDLLDSGTFWLSETPDVPSKTASWGASNTRVCSWVKLCDKWSGKTFLYYNTHLDHISETARVNGADLIMSKMEGLNLPTILTGDFNARENSQVYNVVSEKFDDSKYVATETEDVATYNGWSADGGSAIIDFCFLSKEDFDVSSYDVNVWTFPDPKAENPEEAAIYYPSDHNAVVVKAKIK